MQAHSTQMYVDICMSPINIKDEKECQEKKIILNLSRVSILSVDKCIRLIIFRQNEHCAKVMMMCIVIKNYI